MNTARPTDDGARQAEGGSALRIDAHDFDVARGRDGTAPMKQKPQPCEFFKVNAAIVPPSSGSSRRANQTARTIASRSSSLRTVAAT